MRFDTEYELEKFRSIEPEMFDNNGKVYGGIRHVSNSQAEMMRNLINILVGEIKYLEQ